MSVTNRSVIKSGPCHEKHHHKHYDENHINSSQEIIAVAILETLMNGDREKGIPRKDVVNTARKINITHKNVKGKKTSCVIEPVLRKLRDAKIIEPVPLFEFKDNKKEHNLGSKGNIRICESYNGEHNSVREKVRKAVPSNK